jgi:hypothetical protein
MPSDPVFAFSALDHAMMARALRPSRLVASFTRNHGRPRSIRDRKPWFKSRACASISPASTWMPAARSFS